MNLRSYRLLLDPTGDGGNGAPAPAPTPPPAKPTESDLSGSIQSLIAKHGSSERAIGFLLGEHKDYRRRLREAKAASTPPEGSVTLSADDAKAWEQFKALGKPEDLKSALDERATLKDEVDKARTADRIGKAAKAHSFKEGVLLDLATSKGLDIEVRDETVNGKAAPVAFVKHADDKGKPAETRLPDYVKSHLSDYLPSLSIQPERTPAGTPPRADHAGPPPSTTGKRPDLFTGNPFSS